MGPFSVLLYVYLLLCNMHTLYAYRWEVSSSLYSIIIIHTKYIHVWGCWTLPWSLNPTAMSLSIYNFFYNTYIYMRNRWWVHAPLSLVIIWFSTFEFIFFPLTIISMLIKLRLNRPSTLFLVPIYMQTHASEGIPPIGPFVGL